MVRILLLIILLISYAEAATVTISDTLLSLTGQPIDCILQITPSISFTTSDEEEVTTESRSIRVTGGVVNFEIYPNAGSTPTNTSYTVQYRTSTSGIIFNTETWVVPNTDPVDINTIRVSSPPLPGLTITLSQITQSSATSGQVPAWNGTSWVPSTISASGIDCATLTPLTIASGGITITGSSCFPVDTEGSSSSDDVTAINCTTGQLFILFPVSSVRTVVMKASSLTLATNIDFRMDDATDQIFMRCASTNNAVELFRFSSIDD